MKKTFDNKLVLLDIGFNASKIGGTTNIYINSKEIIFVEYLLLFFLLMMQNGYGVTLNSPPGTLLINSKYVRRKVGYIISHL